jgi:hypothetical protein
MKARPDSARSICKEVGLSLSQWQQAKDAGVDVKSLDAMKAFRETINPRPRHSSETANRPVGDDGELMSLDDLEKALGRKDITPNEALTLQRQINAMKQLAQYRQAMGQLISRDEVKDHFIRCATSIQSFLRKFEKEIPALCLGLPINQSSPKVKERIREMQAEWANLEGEFWSDHQET